MKIKGQSGGVTILAIIITAIVIGGGMYMWQKPSQDVQNDADVVVVDDVGRLEELYESVKFHYSFRYPKEWYIRKWATGDEQPEIICITQEISVSGETNCLVSITINTSDVEASVRENLTSREELIFANHPATKIAFTAESSPPLVSILVPFDQYVYVISYDPQDIKQEVVANIVESFTFTL